MNRKRSRFGRRSQDWITVSFLKILNIKIVFYLHVVFLFLYMIFCFVYNIFCYLDIWDFFHPDINPIDVLTLDEDGEEERIGKIMQ